MTQELCLTQILEEGDTQALEKPTHQENPPNATSLTGDLKSIQDRGTRKSLLDVDPLPTAADVCMVIDLEGFFVQGTFQVRELGFYTWRGCHGRFAFYPSIKWNELSPKDKKTVWTVKHKVHGLTYSPRKNEHAFKQSYVKELINYLYQRNGIDGKELVAYKGGHVEKDLLNALWIPNINLEPFGCPKFEKVIKTIVEPLEGCGFHEYCDNAHCSMVECHAFWLWMTTHM